MRVDPSDEQSIYRFCERMSGQKAGDFTITWEFPGCLCLTAPGQLNDIMVVATPDCLNGRLSTIVFEITVDGWMVALPDVNVIWNADDPASTYRAAVADRRDAILEVIKKIRAGAVNAFIELYEACPDGIYRGEP